MSPYLSLETKNKVSTTEIKDFNDCSAVEFATSKYRKTKKFTGIANYIESDNHIYLKFKNNGYNHNLVIDKKTSSIKLYYSLVDNLTNIRSPRFSTVYNNSVVVIVEDWEMENFISNVNEGKISTSNNNIDLSKLSINSNPVILLYK